jgi:AraC-like DNA-binding protein
MDNFQKYFAPYEENKEWGVKIITVGYSKTLPKNSYPSIEHPSNHYFTWNSGRILDGYYLVYISSGEGIFETAENSPIKIVSGMCLFLTPNVWHRYKPDDKLGWDEYWIGFKGSYPDYLMKNDFFEHFKQFVEIGFNESIIKLFHQLIETSSNTKPGYLQILSGITMHLLGFINYLSLIKETDEYPTIKMITRAKFIIEELLETKVDMKKIAKQLHMGYSKFRKTFKEHTKLSPNQYLLNLRLNKAKLLLKSSEINISNISYLSGFESVFYFSEIFKKKTGLSPSQYRMNSKKSSNRLL